MLGKFWKSFRKLLAAHRAPTRVRHTHRRSLLNGEVLEQREMLSANQIAYHPLLSAIVIEGTAGADTVSVWTDASNIVHVTMQNSLGLQTPTFAGLSLTQIRFIGGDGNDSFTNSSAIPSLALGEGGNDMLSGGAGGGTFYGGAGDDFIYGGTGVDQIYGDDGNDWADAGGGNDVLYGGAGADTLNGGDNDDSIYGETGLDTLSGGNGNDFLSGAADRDVMYGGSGNDTLNADDGDDELYGDDGIDTLNGGIGVDQLRGGIGDDILRGGVGNDTLSGEDGDDDVYGDEGDDTLYGGFGNDYLEGNIGNDTLYGGVGIDALNAGDGNDMVWGEDGNDSLNGGLGNDLLQGGYGDDVIYAGAGVDTLTGDGGADNLYGEDGDDSLYGGDDGDFLSGGIGNDLAYGGTGDDTLHGDDGDDHLHAEDGNDWLRGGNGHDLLRGGYGNDKLFAGVGNDVGYGDEGVDDIYGEDGSDTLYGGGGNDYVDGGIGNDFLQGHAGNDTLEGGEGDDRLYGSEDVDLLKGGNGNDILQGGHGDDVLFGGAGRDSLSGHDGDDDLWGEDDNDTLSGGNGNDILQGGLGNDSLSGNDGNDTLHGEDGNDNLAGGVGNDLLEGETGDDSLYGGAGADLLLGEEGHNNLFGEDGDDYLAAGSGNDVLVGGSGNDQLYAAAGNDLLIGGAGIDLVSGDDGEDIVIGGSTAYDTDVAKLRAIDSLWSAVTPYSLRVAQLEDESYANYLESLATVYDDYVADTLLGGNQQDWFIQTGYMATYRPSDVQPYTPQPDEGHHTTIITSVLPPLEGFAFVDAIDKTSDRKTDETLRTLIPHADTSTLQREHLSLFQLVRYSQVTNYAVASGNWSNPSTWKNGVVPPSGARVLIPIGVRVDVDGLIPARIDTIRVDGELTFKTTVDTELRVDTMIVSGTGSFEMGTQTNPIAAGKTARLFIINNGAIDRTKDPFAIGRGLISHGKVAIYGSTVTSYVAIAGVGIAGSTTLALQSVPIGWKAGDSVAIAATTEGSLTNEVRRIATIVGNVVTLDQPLFYNHLPPVGFDVHIANTSRNAVIESESAVTDRRGHVMFMHARDVHIGYAGFYTLGRTDKMIPINDPALNADWSLKAGTGTNPRARYSVHFHRNGLTNDGNPSVILGSAVVDSPGWGYVNHSSYVDMFDNVAVGVRGSAFNTEVGDEIGGFYGNIAIGTTGAAGAIDSRESIQDYGFQGDGFWFQGPGISVIGNIAAGNQESGFVYYAHGLIEGGVRKQFVSANLDDPSIANGATMIDVNLVPIKAFRDNISYANHFGLLERYVLQGSTSSAKSFVEDSLFWNNRNGVYMPYTENTTLQNLTILNNQPVSFQEGVSGNISTRNNTYKDLDISGYWIGIDPPRRGNVLITGGTYSNNVHDVLLYTAAVEDRNVLITDVSSTMKVTTVHNTVPWGLPGSVFFVHDTITLNFGQFQNQRLYYFEQTANYVPFPTPRSDMPAAYIGLTNQQLWDQFGIALSGEIAPGNAYTAPNIIGLVAPRVLGLRAVAEDERSFRTSSRDTWQDPQ